MKKPSYYSTADLTITEQKMLATQIEELILLLWPEEIESPGLADKWLARIEAPGNGYLTSDGIKAPGHDDYFLSALAHQAQTTMAMERPRLRLYPLHLDPPEPEES